MKKEILKGFTMLMVIAALALATAVASANAQSSISVKANVPFEFIVGDKTLPAGEYSMRPANSSGNALMILGTMKSAIRLTGTTAQKKDDTTSRLVFHRYGQNYFLCEVWNGDSTGRQLLKSRQERAIERELASLPPSSDPAQNTYETIVVVAVLR